MGDNQQNHYYHQNQNQHVFQQQQFAHQNHNPTMAQHQQYNYPGGNQSYNQPGNYGNQQQYAQQNQQYYDYPAADDDYEQDDFDNLAEIEREMNKSSSLNNFGEEDAIINEFEKDIETRSFPNAQNKFLPAGAMPTNSSGALSAHAAEFWFPECRNCECCKGFKHGCSCCTGGVNTCSATTCVDDVFKQQVSTDLASRPATITTTTGAGAYKVESPRSEAPVRPVPVISSGGDICKFESYPGGCKFGSTCRFKHSNAAGPPSSGAAGGKQPCMFFARGNCQYGDGCRFGHF